MYEDEIKLFLRIQEHESLGNLINSNVELLRDVLGFGTYLLRHIVDKNREPEDLNIILLIREELECIDGINELFSKSCVNASIPVLRNLFETFLNLNYMLKEETKKRSLSYDVVQMHEQLELCRKIKNGENIPNKPDDVVIQEIEKRENYLKNKLNSEKYLDIEREFKIVRNIINRKHRDGKNIIIPKWYSLFNGPRNIFELSKRVDQEQLYKGIYPLWSSKTHASLVHKNIQNGIIVSSRDETSMVDFTAQVKYMAIISYLNIKKYYVDAKYEEEYKIWINNINDKFEKLRKRALDWKKIKVNNNY